MLSLACWAEAEMIFKASKKKKEIFKAAQLGKKGDRETNWQRGSKTWKTGRQDKQTRQIPVVFFKSGESSGSFAT